MFLIGISLGEPTTEVQISRPQEGTYSAPNNIFNNATLGNTDRGSLFDNSDLYLYLAPTAKKQYPVFAYYALSHQ
jgi:hypothetical protein